MHIKKVATVLLLSQVALALNPFATWMQLQETSSKLSKATAAAVTCAMKAHLNDQDTSQWGMSTVEACETIKPYIMEFIPFADEIGVTEGVLKTMNITRSMCEAAVD
ncbi:hypothetical protein BGZ83_000641 [Gryganskiella cystojenkinii]|nr:hypothetical protein BGZ83_000641 [Gryganskiella cystojenkinii]